MAIQDKNISTNNIEPKTAKIYTVTEVTRSVKLILEDAIDFIWIEGEVSNLRTPTSGHMYFTLKDQFSSLNCVMFRANTQGVKFDLKDGLNVICFGKISVYEKGGQYQLYVETIEPKGLGALQLAFQQLKERLSKEGLFAIEHKKPIPMLPGVVGIVTSPTGAAIRDILNILTRRFENLTILINPVKVQGEGAAEEVANAIEEFNNIEDLSEGRFKRPGVLILTRGGGSLEDLWEFNEEIVARAIYNSKIPVISAIGHEIDWTIADFVADLRSPTPSAAAEMVIAQKDHLTEKIEIFSSRLKLAVFNRIDSLKETVDSLSHSFVLKDPINVIIQQQQRVDDLTRQIVTRICYKIQLEDARFNRLIYALENLSPLNILKRGYSITSKIPEGTTIKDASMIKIGDTIKSKLSRGNIISKVEKISEE